VKELSACVKSLFVTLSVSEESKSKFRFFSRLRRVQNDHLYFSFHTDCILLNMCSWIPYEQIEIIAGLSKVSAIELFPKSISN
jgi:hypothetical protein